MLAHPDSKWLVAATRGSLIPETVQPSGFCLNIFAKNDVLGGLRKLVRQASNQRRVVVYPGKGIDLRGICHASVAVTFFEQVAYANMEIVKRHALDEREG